MTAHRLSPPMPLWPLRSIAELEQHGDMLWSLFAGIPSWERTPLVEDQTLPGYSYTAGELVKFRVDWNGGKPNWRESVICPVSGLSNRVRAAYHTLASVGLLTPQSKIYLTEQSTLLYNYVKDAHPQSIGSEYQDGVPLGHDGPTGLRSEDMTKLTFEDGTFDALISLDVLEHIPDYKSALSEAARILRPGGVAALTAPFVWKAKNVERARFVDGVLEHLLPPEYHGDPMSEHGVLCYRYYGFEILEDLRAAGFSDAYVGAYHSEELGYLGGVQMIMVAIK